MRSYIELCINTDETNDSNTEHPVVRLEFRSSVTTFDGVIEDLIRPALLASGFSKGTVDNLVILEEPES